MLAVLVLVASASANLNDGLIDYYKFDDDTGDDIFGLNHLGNFGTTNTTGINASGRNFDGSLNQYMENDSFTGAETIRSISLWMNASSTIDNDVVISFYDTTLGRYLLYFFSNKLYSFYDGKFIEPSSFSISTGDWYNIVLVFGGNGHKMYINGVLDAVNESKDVFVSGMEKFYLGFSPSNNEFSGVIDEVGIWNRNLTETEITELYSGGAGIFYPFPADPAYANTSYDAEVYETQRSWINISFENVNATTANLHYNGIVYTGTKTTGLTTINYTNYVIAPFINSSTYSLPFYFEYTIFNITTVDAEIENDSINVALPENAFDENWNTASFGTFGGFIYENFTIPPNVNSANWTFKLRGSDLGNSIIYCKNYSSTSWANLYEALNVDEPSQNTSLPIFNDCIAGTKLKIATYLPSGSSVNANYWEGKVSWDTGGMFNTTTEYQTITKWLLENCSEGNTTMYFNFYEEDNPQSRLNNDLDLDMVYWAFNSSLQKNYSHRYTGNNYYGVCLSPYDLSLQTNVYAKYNRSDSFTHRTYLINQSLSNTTFNVSAYNFLDNTGKGVLRITTRYNSDYSYYVGVYAKLQRYYPAEQVWRTVQMEQSDDYGQANFNIKQQNTDYRVIFTDIFDRHLKTSGTLRFSCDNDVCEVTFLLNPYSGTLTSRELNIGWNFDNETNLLTVTWDDPTGATSSVRVILSKETMGGTATICDITKSGSAGQTACNTSGYEGATFLRIRSSASPEADSFAEWLNLPRTYLSNVIGARFGAFLSFGIVLTLVGAAAVVSPLAALIALVFGVIVVSFLGLFNALTVGILIAVAAIALLIAMRGKK